MLHVNYIMYCSVYRFYCCALQLGIVNRKNVHTTWSNMFVFKNGTRVNISYLISYCEKLNRKTALAVVLILQMKSKKNCVYPAKG